MCPPILVGAVVLMGGQFCHRVESQTLTVHVDLYKDATNLGILDILPLAVKDVCVLLGKRTARTVCIICISLAFGGLVLQRPGHHVAPVICFSCIIHDEHALAIAITQVTSLYLLISHNGCN